MVLDLGEMPLSDGLMRPGDDRSAEPRYPLTLVWCEECSLVQILETVDPRTLFGSEYPYYSSYSPALLEHSRNNVEGIMRRAGLDEESLVVELASNDGYLLQWFVKEDIPVLGIDPAPGPAEAARARGIETICEFFDIDLARRLAEAGRRADVIIGNNVLAHVPDQNHFVEAIETLLAPSGMVVMEFPYVRDFVDHCEFDTIYHEHHCYFSVTAVRELFKRHDLDLVSVEHLDIHGGSLRVTFERDGEPDESVGSFLVAEREAGLLEPSYYRDFADRAESIRNELVSMLSDLKSRGATVAAYGAAAKGATLLNFCGVGEDLISYVVDRNDHKHGWEMPGSPIPIRGTEALQSDPPDYLLILAWNFKDEIMAQQAWYPEQGGRFIIPIPYPAVV
jgi:SAM-dependent methyltransferase